MSLLVYCIILFAWNSSKWIEIIYNHIQSTLLQSLKETCNFLLGRLSNPNKFLMEESINTWFNCINILTTLYIFGHKEFTHFIYKKHDGGSMTMTLKHWKFEICG